MEYNAQPKLLQFLAEEASKYGAFPRAQAFTEIGSTPLLNAKVILNKMHFNPIQNLYTPPAKLNRQRFDN